MMRDMHKCIPVPTDGVIAKQKVQSFSPCFTCLIIKTLDKPFFKGAAQNDLVLGDSSGSVGNLNTLFTPGVYNAYATATGHPTGNGQMLIRVYKWDFGFYLQEANRATNGEYYFRAYDKNNSTWSSWYRVNVTAL